MNIWFVGRIIRGKKVKDYLAICKEESDAIRLQSDDFESLDTYRKCKYVKSK